MKVSLQQLTVPVSVLSLALLQGIQPASAHCMSTKYFPCQRQTDLTRWLSLFDRQWRRIKAMGVYPVGSSSDCAAGLVKVADEYCRPTDWFRPNYEYSGIDAMCGFNATKPMFPINTLKIEAGSDISFGAAGQARQGDESKLTIPVSPFCCSASHGAGHSSRY